MKLSTLVTSLLLVVSFSAQSAIRKLDLELYPQGIPGAIDTSNEGKLFDERFNDRFITAISKPSLTLYLPESKAVEKTVIICPGGGYFGVSSIKEGQEVAERFAANGVAAAVLWYRMPNPANMEVPHQGPLQDLQQAFYRLQQGGEQWQLNQSQFGVMGFSAGGHLAATGATHFAQPVIESYDPEVLRPAFQILIYPVISMQANITHEGSRNLLLGEQPDAALVTAYSNELQVTEQTPPAYIVHANDDSVVVVDNALEYYAALREQKVAVRMLLLEEGGHGFGMRHQVDWFAGVLDWVKAQ